MGYYMDKYTVIYDGTLIDCVTAEPRHHAAVLIKGDKIEAVGRAGEMAIPADAQYVDARGKTIMPGMIDAHIHITGNGDPNQLRRMKKTVPFQAIEASLHARALLEAGFTSIRDAGAAFLLDIGLRDAVNAGLVPGPRMKVSGRGLSITGGHGDSFFPPEIEFASRYVVDSPDEARKAAREQLRAGADCIKLLATGGVMSEKSEPTTRGLTVDEMRAAIEEAKNVGAKTLAHAQGTLGIKNAIIAGINSIDHGFYLDDEAIELMIKHDVFMVPTLAAVHHIVVNGERMGVPAWGVRKALEGQAAHVVSFRKALDAGVKIAMGTDAATPFNFHGKNALELELMCDAGMTPAHALLSTTRLAAELLGTLDEVGTVEPGKLADLILVKGDPLADITVLQPADNIQLVLKGGDVAINRGVKIGCRDEQG
jgi:imidazolonepropionase-like amidohydrolase